MAIAIAQDTERKTFEKAYLSVQELIDCDNKRDRGCTGGNPLLAYPFIHRYGLLPESIYPYIGLEAKCRRTQISTMSSSSYPSSYFSPYSSFDQRRRQKTIDIATAESWGILAVNDEGNMEMVLRYVGPIAVGFDGSDPSFLAYAGGVYDCENCRSHLNHALLIVGYGEVPNDDDAGVTKYWIARNSWGEGWGENGYVRIKRGGAKSKESFGVCGIAKNPNVALGGYFLHTNAGARANNRADTRADTILGTDGKYNNDVTTAGKRNRWGVPINGERPPSITEHSRLPSWSTTASTPHFNTKGFTLSFIVVTALLGLIAYRTANRKSREHRKCRLPSIHTMENEILEKNCILTPSMNDESYGSVDTATVD